MLSEGTKKHFRQILVAVIVLGLAEAAVFFAVSLASKVSLPKAVAGDLLGCAAAIANFYFLALSVEKSVSKGKAGAGAFMALSYVLRMLLIVFVVMLAILKPEIFNLWATVIPFTFPQIGIFVLNIGKKRSENNER